MTILDLLFPRKCLGCGREGSYFCSQCLNYFSLDNGRICPVCEKPAIGGETHPKCSSRLGLDGLTSVFAYKGLIALAITKLKYRFVTDIADDLVEAFISCLGEDEAFRRICRKGIYLVPVPLHANRERWRGFSQTTLLGEIIAQRLKIGYAPGLLIRVKDTKPQVGLGEKERRENIQDAFSIPTNSQLSLRQSSGQAIIHSQFILFDDVWTSGATMKEAARIIKKAGAKSVWGLSLAR